MKIYKIRNKHTGEYAEGKGKTNFSKKDGTIFSGLNHARSHIRYIKGELERYNHYNINKEAIDKLKNYLNNIEIVEFELKENRTIEIENDYKGI